MKENGKEQGTVKWFNDGRGYGFISRGDGKVDVFVHHSGIQQKSGRRTLREGQQVEFEVAQGPKGMKAVKVVTL